MAEVQWLKDGIAGEEAKERDQASALQARSKNCPIFPLRKCLTDWTKTTMLKSALWVISHLRRNRVSISTWVKH